MLHEALQRLGSHGVLETVVGMAHRGRLNVLVNILGKNPQQLFDEFDGKMPVEGTDEGSGDVKYHQGFSTNVMTPGGEMHLALAFNPSHLEIVGPVVEGSVRARQDRRGDARGERVAPIIIHGDAAFAGQGVVMETFQMSQTRGFRTGAPSTSSSTTRSVSPRTARTTRARPSTARKSRRWCRRRSFT